MTPAPQPALLKKRQKHSRWFAVLLVALLLVTTGKWQLDGLGYIIFHTLAIGLIATCALGRAYCSAFIGGIKNDRVVRDGPFSVVRNPLYVFSFLGLIGMGLASGMLALPLLLAVAFIVYYKNVVAREEAFLLHKFGAPYEAYLREVPRWWPNWRLWNEPAETTVRPQFIRKTMLDAMIFFLAIPAFQLLQWLHAGAVLPVYFTLP